MDQKTEVPGFYKTDSNYLINKDNEALFAYKKKKQQNIKIKVIEEDLCSLKQDMIEIKNILKQMVK